MPTRRSGEETWRPSWASFTKASSGSRQGLPTSRPRECDEDVSRSPTSSSCWTTYSSTERFEPKKFIAHGDDVVVLGEETFRVRATGKLLNCEWAQVCEVKHGKVTRFHEYIDVSAIVEEVRKAKEVA